MNLKRALSRSLWFLNLLLLPSVTLFGRSAMPIPLEKGCSDGQTMLTANQSGSAMVQQVLAASMPWGDSALNEYVNRLGQNLARSSGSQGIFTFYVVYDPEVNAQAFAGGYIVVNTGAISLAESEAELASVVSHEIAHENSCDGRKTTGKGNLIELLTIVPAVAIGGPAGLVLTAGAGWGASAARARFNRAEEERADRLAALYLVHAGYDPRASIRFFERLDAEQKRAGGRLPGLLATHPSATDRKQELEKLIPHLPAPEFAVHDEAEFVHMRQSVLDYDRIYSRVTGVRAPGHQPPDPQLSRRPESEKQQAVGSRQ